MAISRYEEMGELEFDILKEIGSIGGGMRQRHCPVC